MIMTLILNTVILNLPLNVENRPKEPPSIRTQLGAGEAPPRLTMVEQPEAVLSDIGG